MNAFRTRGVRNALVALLAAAIVAGCSDSDRGDSGTSRITRTVTLTGAQENPAVTTAATGNAVFTVDPATGAVSGTVTTSGISATVGHIHEAAPGTNGSILVPLTQDPPGTWTVAAGATLTAAQVEAFKAGNLYMNVHSAANPGGEIRGQIGRSIYYATLTGAQEVPAVTTAATGSGRFIYDPETRTLSGSVTTTGITGTVAHLHAGAVGIAGPVSVPLAGGPSTWTLAPTVLTEAQAGALGSDFLYANVHSAANPGGEVRGQLHSAVRFATLSGLEEVPPVATAARGVGWMMVNPFTKGAAIRLETSGITATAAHVHRAALGVAGPVVIPLTQGPPGIWTSSATATISDELMASFMKGELYLNAHTPANPTGEIRGQLLPLR